MNSKLLEILKQYDVKSENKFQPRAMQSTAVAGPVALNQFTPNITDRIRNMYSRTEETDGVGTLRPEYYVSEDGIIPPPEDQSLNAYNDEEYSDPLKKLLEAWPIAGHINIKDLIKHLKTSKGHSE